MTAQAETIREFYSENGINAEIYDARTVGFPGEIDFYVRRAVASGGPVLEIASGTGRIAWPIARAGIHLTGIDLSRAMMAVAEAKRANEPAEVNARIRFVRADMTDFSLGTTFALAIIPFRAFQALLTSDAQRSALACIRRHLRPNGRLIVDLFDPRLDLLMPGRIDRPLDLPGVRHPRTGNTVRVEVLERFNDVVRQQLSERWRFTERDASDAIVREEIELLELRWSYRYEMMHLFELTGFVVEEEFSDFLGAPPAYGKEQLWVLRRA
jgi:SAM-dependent methyltransferase